MSVESRQARLDPGRRWALGLACHATSGPCIQFSRDPEQHAVVLGCARSSERSFRCARLLSSKTRPDVIMMATMPTVLVIGALDTKGTEVAFLTEQIRRRGHQTLVMDVGVLGEPAFEPGIPRQEVARAAGALCGMLEAEAAADEDKPLICASMFGNTTPCVESARAILERAGYEVLVFHATGAGGQTMESLIESGHVAGVLDVTTTEWADELVGGVLSAGSTRLEAAARTGTPAVVAPGCLDMVNFWARDTVPERFHGRLFYQHNPNITLMRTTPEENAELGRILAEKLNRSTGPVAVYLPLRGLSAISTPGGAFHSPEADRALFHALRTHLRPDIPVKEIHTDINDPAFARAAANGLLDMLARPPV